MLFRVRQTFAEPPRGYTASLALLRRSQITLATVGMVVVAILLSIGFGTSAGTGSWKIPAVLLALVCIIVLGIERPAFFIGTVLIVRPLLDSSSESKIHVGLSAVNFGGALGLCVLVVLVGYLVTTRHITMPTLSRAFTIVLAFSAVMTIEAYENFGSSASTSAVTEMIRLAAIFGVFILAANVASSPSSVRRIFSIFALSAVIPAFVAIFQFSTGGAIASSGLLIERAFGTFSGPNPLGEYSAICALILLCAPADLMRRSIRILALAIVLGALAISYSRAGYAMFLIGVIAIEYRRISQKLIWFAAVLAIVLIVVPSVRNRILPTGTTATSQEKSYAKTGETGLLAGNGTYGSFGWRLYNWSKLLNKWERSPILGYGLQTTVLVNPVHQHLPNGTIQGFVAHNTGVRALVEGGVIMLLIWMFFCASLIGSSTRPKNESWDLQPYARILWGIWTAIVVIAFATDDPFTNTALMYGCFAVTGALQVAYARHRHAIYTT